MSNGSPFQTLDLAQVQKDLRRLYEQVAQAKGRIQIRGEDGASTCVLISKEELDSLEKALEILSDTDDVKAMRDSIAACAAISETQEAQI